MDFPQRPKIEIPPLDTSAPKDFDDTFECIKCGRMKKKSFAFSTEIYQCDCIDLIASSLRSKK